MGWGFFQVYDGLFQHQVLGLHQIRYGMGLLPMTWCGTSPGGYGGDVVELLLATALLLDWYRRGARALAREERRQEGTGPRCRGGAEGYPSTVFTIGGTSS